MGADNTQVREAHVAVVLNGRGSLEAAALQLCLTACVFRLTLLVRGTVSADSLRGRNGEGVTANALALEAGRADESASTGTSTGVKEIFPCLVGRL